FRRVLFRSVLSCGIRQLPVFVSLARKDGTNVAAAHGDHDIGILYRICGKDIGESRGDVDVFFSHGLHGHGIELIGWFGTRGTHFNTALTKFLQEPGGHLGSSGIVHADEEHAGSVVGGGHSSDSSLGYDIGCSRGCLARYRDRGIVWEEFSTKPYGHIDQSHQHWHFNEGANDACERLAGGDTKGADGYRD